MAATDGVSHPPHQCQYQADDEEDDPEDQNNVGEGEGRDETREDEPQDYGSPGCVLKASFSLGSS
jgi:hypothetical protein